MLQCKKSNISFGFFRPLRGFHRLLCRRFFKPQHIERPPAIIYKKTAPEGAVFHLWREYVGIEPTQDATNAQRLVLKTRGHTSTHLPPKTGYCLTNTPTHIIGYHTCPPFTRAINFIAPAVFLAERAAAASLY